MNTLSDIGSTVLVYSNEHHQQFVLYSAHQSTVRQYQLLFAQQSRQYTILYNEYPSNTDVIKPFTEPGGYIIVVQRQR